MERDSKEDNSLFFLLKIIQPKDINRIAYNIISDVMIHEQRSCNRCGYEWEGRLQRTPKTCPQCRSPYWNKVRIINNKPEPLMFEV